MPKLILITGQSSCGKSTYSKSLGKPIITFDDVMNYQKMTINYDLIKKKIETYKNEDAIVLDAYIFSLDPDFEKLKNTFNNNITNIEIYHIYTPLDTIAITTFERSNNGYHPYSTDYHDMIEHIIKEITYINDSCINLKQKLIVDKYIYIYRNGKEYVHYDDDNHLNSILNGNGMTTTDYLLKYIDKISGDPKYQTIEVNNKIIRHGASNCPLSWDNILKTGINFTNKTVCDLGSFNGYFSIKCKKAGASLVDGYDINEPALKVAKLVSLYNNQKCSFYKKNIGNDTFTNNYDIIIALNMLHHIKLNYGEIIFKRAIDDIFKHSNEALFEVNDKEILDIKTEAINNHFTLIKTVESHRKTMFGNRFILYFKKNN